MKKFCLILATCLVLAGNARAENFVEALGAECGRILFDMEEHTYPDMYPNLMKRNSQFDAVEKCLQLYKQNGGKRNRPQLKGYSDDVTLAEWLAKRETR